MRPHDAQVRHVDPLTPVLFDQRHLPEFVDVFRKQGCDFLPRQTKSTRMSLSLSAPGRQRHGPRTNIEVALVDLVDDLQVSGQQRLQQLHRPTLQSLGQNGVVGVGEGASGEVPGLPRLNDGMKP